MTLVPHHQTWAECIPFDGNENLFDFFRIGHIEKKKNACFCTSILFLFTQTLKATLVSDYLAIVSKEQE